VVHHALCRVIEPRFERVFIPDSYANRVGRGVHRAVDRLQQFAHSHRYVLRADIRQHFASIDHAYFTRSRTDISKHRGRHFRLIVDGVSS
jgi:retron-type reverse transcriptase